MPDEKRGFKLRDFFSNIGSKANTERPSFTAPSGGGDIKTQMDWKHGLGEFADIKKRRKPGESKFNYDVRMKKEARKRAMGTNVEKGVLEQEITDTSDLTREQRLALGEKLHPETNPNDKRDQSQVQNFGIKPGMSFSEAFAQAGKGDARAGIDTFFWTNPETQEEKTFLYDFADKTNDSTDDKYSDIDQDGIDDILQGTTRYKK